MRVVITSHGSTGDIVPMIALGRALMAAGHETVFAASGLFQELIEGSGVPFRSVPPDWSVQDGSEAMKSLSRVNQPLKQLERIYQFGLPYYHEYLDILEELLTGADLLVSSYLYPFLQTVAEQKGARFAVATFAHNSVPTAVNAPLPGLSAPFLPGALGRAWRNAWWGIADFTVTRTLNGVVYDVLRARNIPKARSFFRTPAPLALVTVSEKLFAPPREHLDSRFTFTGYWRYQTPINETIERELDDFCAGEEVPVLNFGSVTWDSAENDFAELLSHWPKGKKLIVQSGWAGFRQAPGAERQEIKIIGHANHDRLFARASVVIHHGGAGTTASALHSGRPQIIIPHIADQFFWANECQKLGLSMTGKRAVWPKQLARWVDQIERDSALRQTAENAATTLQKEDGPARAVTLLENYIKQ
ncbi:glycosyltransferase [Cerasicoccus arenae]|uniref:Glycosyl transferase n=1 Tax=Cerasicoccus arenae TaxID=424488 RepID=A0A8J3DI66_9BACT|nr:nucleotide disphospho-sugar-binding domain-containing protein [Cerasicoccus arenae]MBK1857550.1 glycosyltransferase [Cerasicoccus arenae]GHB95680.1 glycosyl transferase [Cerasicoccus arenae]